MKKILFVALMLAMLAVPIMVCAEPDGGSSATASAGASITIQTIPISLEKYQDLSFGTIIPGSSAGYVSLYFEGGVSHYTTSGGGPVVISGIYPAEVLINGHPNLSFGITAPTTDTTLSDGNGHSMILNNVCLSQSGNQLNVGGQAWFEVGGDLQVDANQARGYYTGSFDVTVDYD